MGAQLGHEADPDVLRWNGEYYLPAKFECRKENDASVHYDVGCQYLLQGRYKAAMADFDKALQLKPGNAVALNRRGEAKRMLGRYEEAIADFDKALQLEPGDAFALRSRGEAKRQLGRYDEAVTDSHEALRIRPDWYLLLLSKMLSPRAQKGRGGKSATRTCAVWERRRSELWTAPSTSLELARLVFAWQCPWQRRWSVRVPLHQPHLPSQ